MYKILYEKRVLKEVKYVPNSIKIRIFNEIEKLSLNPYPTQSKKLQGTKNIFRLRVGLYRVIYSVRNKNLIILIVRIAHRKDAYI